MLPRQNLVAKKEARRPCRVCEKEANIYIPEVGYVCATDAATLIGETNDT